MLTARQMLELATINGAHVAGLEDRTGSLTPGSRPTSSSSTRRDQHGPGASTRWLPWCCAPTSPTSSTSRRRRVPQAGLQPRRRHRECPVLVEARGTACQAAATAPDGEESRRDACPPRPPRGRGTSASPPAVRRQRDRVRHLARRRRDDAGAVHTGFGLATRAGGHVPAHVHSYEESFYVLDGEVVVQTPRRAARLGPATTGSSRGCPPRVAQRRSGPVRWAQMSAPATPGGVRHRHLPGARAGLPPTPWHRRPRPAHPSLRPHRPRPTWTRRSRPRTGWRVSASMRTALLVYSGITREDDGRLRPRRDTVDDVHGAVRARTGSPEPTTTPSRRRTWSSRARSRRVRRRAVHAARPGDVAWAGVGCVHGFRNVGDGARALAGDAGARSRQVGTPTDSPATGRTSGASAGRRKPMTDDVVVGGNSGHRAGGGAQRAQQGDHVVVTGRDAARASQVASSTRRRRQWRRARPGRAGEASAPPSPASAGWTHLVLGGDRTRRQHSGRMTSTRPCGSATLKLIGYTEVVHALLPADSHDDSAIVIFGGRAKDRPYPGSTTVSTVNGGVVGMVQHDGHRARSRSG